MSLPRRDIVEVQENQEEEVIHLLVVANRDPTLVRLHHQDFHFKHQVVRQEISGGDSSASTS